MLRLAPSAVNRQPWRILLRDRVFHFYKAEERRRDGAAYDIQKLDVGITACHFHMAAIEKSLSGKFEKLETGSALASENMQYLFSWIAE